ADAANHVVNEIQQLGGQAFACRCDITSEQELSALADFAISKLGKVDILVNNACLIRREDAIEFSEKNWDDVMNLNIKS
ncbi:SDR family NAD(P)-dependent oxidoreductase, partial [Klebsiella pneumoniae]|uniref:SDR family NAD(P)-dependent oxidoreductase n=1 Tax=Klebsiella pneumoniae TaxID=573 RepID=UPI002554C8B2